MTKLYATTVHNYKTNKTEIVNVNTERLNALFDMESFVTNFILTQDGANFASPSQGRSFVKSSFANVQASLPEGHYIVNNCQRNRDFTKMTVWRKFTGPIVVKGWIWGQRENLAVQWEKVMTVFITEFHDSATVATAATPPATAATTARRRARKPKGQAKEQTKKEQAQALTSCLHASPAFNNLYSIIEENPAESTPRKLVSVLRTNHRDEFTKCPLANQKRAYIKKHISPAANEPSNQELLCTSILTRGREIREQLDELALTNDQGVEHE